MTAKPATPLPWKLGTRYPCRILGVASACEDQDEGTETEGQKQDAAYIVHACNAYPQLVAALSKMLANGPGADHGLGAELSARDLLRDLGEAQS